MHSYNRDEKVLDWSGFPDWALAYDMYNVNVDLVEI